LTYLRLLDDLILNAEKVLEALTGSDTAKLQALADERDETLKALVKLGDLSADQPDAAYCLQRLRRLESLNDRVQAALDQLKDETRDRLSTAAKGRRGLHGYRSVVGRLGEPRARHGRG